MTLDELLPETQRWPAMETTTAAGTADADQWDLDFTAHGDPVGQGGMTAFVVKGTARVAHKNSANLQAWRTAVATAGAMSMLSHEQLLAGPLEVSCSFSFGRPQSHRRSSGALRDGAPSWHTTRPDIDKAIRSVLDALTGVVWGDDSQVGRLVIEKRYGERPGVRVLVRRLG